MRLNKIISIALVLVLSACSSSGSQNQSETVADEDYKAATPYEMSNTRVKHVGIISNEETRIQIEDGLMDLSKTHFSPSDVEYRSHTFLDFDELDATDGTRGLLGTLRDDNPNGLNPGSDEEFDTGNGKVTKATILVDIYELDFYKSDTLKGISLGLVVNQAVGEDETVITEEKMQDYVQVTANKLVNYLRDRFNEISSDIPIYVAAYQLTAEENSDYSGNYIYSGYFDGSTSKYKKIKEQWVNVPSEDFSELDATTAEQFTKFHDDVYNTLSDTSYVIADAKYENGKLRKMDITISAHGKTAGEMMAVSQTAEDSLSVFKSTDATYTVKIENSNETYCILKRSKNTKDVTSVSIL